MTNHTAKIAVTVPIQTLRAVETTRRRLARSRSSVVAEALRDWLSARSSADQDRQYLEGYEKFPEPAEADVAAMVMASWDSWDDGRVVAPAKRSRKSGRR
jgi:hypothetical protein